MSNKALTYKVTDADLAFNAKGKFGEALAAQVRNNIAASLRRLINGAPGAKVYANGDADIITLSARQLGTVGAFTLNVSVQQAKVVQIGSNGLPTELARTQPIEMLSQRASAAGITVSFPAAALTFQIDN